MRLLQTVRFIRTLFRAGCVLLLFAGMTAAFAGGTSPGIGRLDERSFGFFLNVPGDWTADIDTEDGPMLSWRLFQKDWVDGRTPDGLASVSVTVMEPDEGQDTEKAFRSFVGKYAARYLEKGEVIRFEPAQFGGHDGFDARVRGRIKRPTGKMVAVSARLFIYLTADREILVSAVAPEAAAHLLDQLGASGALFETAGPEVSVAGAATPDGETAKKAVTAAAGTNLPEAGINKPVAVIPDTASRFHTFAWGGGVLEEFGSLKPDGLTIVLPPDARTGGVGIASTGSLINLGDLNGGSVTSVRAAFDPQQTDNALLVLCPGRMVPCLSDPSLQILIQKEGTDTVLSVMTVSAVLAKSVLPAGFPAHLAIRIDSDGVYVFPAGGEALLVKRPVGLSPFAALELVVAAVPNPSGARLRLLSASVEQNQPAVAAARLRQPDDNAVIFPASDKGTWQEKAANGGDFASFARFEEGRLMVEVLPGNQWGTTGIVSAKPVFKIAEAAPPRRLHGEVDPEHSRAFALALLPDAGGDVWFSSHSWADFSRGDDGYFRVRLIGCASQGLVSEMVLDAAWSGAFDLIVATDRIELAADRQRISTRLTCGLPDQQGHVAIFAIPRQENDPAGLSLKSLAIDRLALPQSGEPDDGSEAEDAAFDAAGWVAAVGASLAQSNETPEVP